eukprot:Opistho-1_new@27494
MAEEDVVEISADGLVVDRKRLECRLHAVKRRRLPHEIDREIVRALDGNAHVAPKLKADLLPKVSWNVDHVTDALPRAVQLAVVAQAQLIARHELVLAVLTGKVEVRDALLVEAHVPAHYNARLRLRLLHRLVVVRLELHKRTKDVLVLVGVLILCEHRVRVLVDARLLEIVQLGRGIRLPHILHALDLVRRDLPGAQLLVLAGHLDEPGEERVVVDDRLPLREIPVHVANASLRRARLTAEQHHDRVGLRGDEAKKEHIAATAVVTLENRVAKRAVPMQHHLLVLGADKVVDDVARRRAEAAVAEPLLAREALHHRRRAVYAAVAARVVREVLLVSPILVFIVVHVQFRHRVHEVILPQIATVIPSPTAVWSVVVVLVVALREILRLIAIALVIVARVV